MQYEEEEDDLEALLAEPHLPLGSVLMLHANMLRSMGLDDPLQQRLGTGSFGAAYHVPWGGPDGSVLKVTRDPTEVEASVLLSGRKNERIVGIHKVWYLRDSYMTGLARWYLIHRDYLHPLKQLDKNLIEIIFSIYDDTDSRSLTIPSSQRQHGMISKWRGYLHEDLGSSQSLTDEEGETVDVGARASAKDLKRSMQLLLQIGAAVKEMRTAGIVWEDIHSDNMLRSSSGRLVIADVGRGIMHEDFDGEVEALTPELAEQYAAAAQRQPSAV